MEIQFFADIFCQRFPTRMFDRESKMPDDETIQWESGRWRQEMWPGIFFKN